jgi:molybdopterin-guanine dinucleotide biosynthesis protein A
MGTDKALLPFAQKTIIEHVIERITGLVDQVYIVAHDVDSYAFLRIPTLRDIEPDRGPLMGLYTGITSCKTTWVLAAPCDTPFLNSRLLQTILTLPRSTDAIAFEIGGRLQPLPALYSARCAEVAGTLLSSGGRRALQDLLTAVSTEVVPEAVARRVDPELRSFFDLDTTEELRIARQMIDHIR